jgi:phosphoribosylamine-glycine ligase
MAKVNLKEKTVCVFDTSGQYTAIAERLGRKDGFEKVFYCTNWQHSFPKYNSYCVGMGVPNIERVDSLFDVIDICDIFVFPDLYFGAMQDWLRRQGKLVFGSGSGENMEIYRDEFFEMQKEVGLPVGKHEVVKGMTKLRKLLVGKENQWIKTNLLRGQGETFEFKNMKLSASRLDEMEHSFGAYKEESIFCVFDNIEGIELGHDTFIVDGKTMPKVMVGIEIKDSAYCGKIIDYEKTPKVLKTIDTKLGFYFKEHKYRGFFSSEVRWNGKVGYFSDSTNRAPQPPSDLMLEIYDNFPEMVWEIASGNVPEIKATKKYGCQIIVKSSWATNEPCAIYFPEKYKNNVKIKSLMYKDGQPYFVPLQDFPMEEIGSIVATGSTLKEAIENARAIAKEVEGDCLKINTDCLDEAAKEVEELKSYNITLF